MTVLLLTLLISFNSYGQSQRFFPVTENFPTGLYKIYPKTSPNKTVAVSGADGHGQLRLASPGDNDFKDVWFIEVLGRGSESTADGLRNARRVKIRNLQTGQLLTKTTTNIANSTGSENCHTYIRRKTQIGGQEQFEFIITTRDHRFISPNNSYLLDTNNGTSLTFTSKSNLYATFPTGIKHIEASQSFKIVPYTAPQITNFSPLAGRTVSFKGDRYSRNYVRFTPDDQKLENGSENWRPSWNAPGYKFRIFDSQLAGGGKFFYIVDKSNNKLMYRHNYNGTTIIKGIHVAAHNGKLPLEDWSRKLWYFGIEDGRLTISSVSGAGPGRFQSRIFQGGTGYDDDLKVKAALSYSNTTSTRRRTQFLLNFVDDVVFIPYGIDPDPKNPFDGYFSNVYSRSSNAADSLFPNVTEEEFLEFDEKRNVFPIPSNGTLNVPLNLKSPSRVWFNFYTMDGSLAFKKEQFVEKGTKTVTLTGLLSQLKTNTNYLLKAETLSGEVLITSKVIFK